MRVNSASLLPRSVAGASALALVALLLAGCATTGGSRNPDPLEPFNRISYRFNDTLDKALMIPAAKGYQDVTPAPVRRSVGNFFANLRSPIVIANDLLQGKFRQGGSDTARLVVNSTVGLLGLFDPATAMGLPRHRQDFGLTLGRWGIGPGPYLVLPLLGPSDVRDAIGFGVDDQLDPLSQWQQDPAKYELRALDLVDTRARLLPASRIVQESVNPYVFMREGYLQQRRNRVYEGHPPPGAGGLGPMPPPPPPNGNGGPPPAGGGS